MHFRFLTSTPLNVIRGSGTFAAITTLATFLRNAGHTIDILTPTLRVPVYTLERIVFNEMLRRKSSEANATVGFDMDGYALASGSRGLHIASIKGVIADEMRFERGLTRATMRIQASYEKRHVQRADLVIAPSRFAAESALRWPWLPGRRCRRPPVRWAGKRCGSGCIRAPGLIERRCRARSRCLEDFSYGRWN